MDLSSTRRRPVLPLLALLAFALLTSRSAHALDAIVLEVRELTVGGVPIEGASVRLDLVSDAHTRLTVGARTASLPDPVGRLTGIALECTAPVIADPVFGCADGRLVARGGPTGVIDLRIGGEYRLDTGVGQFTGRDLALAGTRVSFEGNVNPRGWTMEGRSGATSVGELAKFVRPWFKLPADLTVDGKLTLRAKAADAGDGLVADVEAAFDGVDLTNEASTLVAEQLSAAATLRARPSSADTALELRVTGTQGQALFGPVLLDLGKNALTLDARGKLSERALSLDAIRLQQIDLIDLSGSGSVDLTTETPALTGEFELARLQFPAAYTSYLQITLAASLLGDLDTSGALNGDFSVVSNAITRLHARPVKLTMRDRKDQLHITEMNGELFWAPADGAAPDASRISWASGGAFGLAGGAAELEFVALGDSIALIRPTKLPVFDGAVAIQTFAMANIGGDDMEVAFRGDVEAISMPLLSKAFGWPELSGTLSGRIPGVQLKDNLLTFDGDIEAQVFGGSIVGSNIRLQDPLGNFPELFADVRARDLDLGMVTNTFEVGSITGKLEADILGLHLFDWSQPIAFDARLATPKGDESRHRISAKAVSTLSNVGGGGGGVVQALQSGVLRYFDEYSYDKLGIRCRLKDDVCVMSGIEPARNGYYIVKGSGLPRIDIIGNSGRVNWPQLMSSIVNAEFGAAEVD